MSEVVIEGTLKPDGTLELDQKPPLPPGRVRVTVQVLDISPPPAETLDPVEEFIGAIHGNVPDWADAHDKYLGQNLAESSRRGRTGN